MQCSINEQNEMKRNVLCYGGVENSTLDFKQGIGFLNILKGRSLHAEYMYKGEG